MMHSGFVAGMAFAHIQIFRLFFDFDGRLQAC
jgi:hypothetical protein